MLAFSNRRPLTPTAVAKAAVRLEVCRRALDPSHQNLFTRDPSTKDSDVIALDPLDFDPSDHPQLSAGFATRPAVTVRAWQANRPRSRRADRRVSRNSSSSWRVANWRSSTQMASRSRTVASRAKGKTAAGSDTAWARTDDRTYRPNGLQREGRRSGTSDEVRRPIQVLFHPTLIRCRAQDWRDVEAGGGRFDSPDQGVSYQAWRGERKSAQGHQRSLSSSSLSFFDASTPPATVPSASSLAFRSLRLKDRDNQSVSPQELRQSETGGETRRTA